MEQNCFSLRKINNDIVCTIASSLLSSDDRAVLIYNVAKKLGHKHHSLPFCQKAIENIYTPTNTQIKSLASTNLLIALYIIEKQVQKIPLVRKIEQKMHTIIHYRAPLSERVALISSIIEEHKRTPSIVLKAMEIVLSNPFDPALKAIFAEAVTKKLNLYQSR
jgi:hypothetical protein